MGDDEGGAAGHQRVHILQHDAQRAAQVGLADHADADAVIADLAVGNVIESVDEVGNGSLACAGGAYEGDLLAGLCPQADVMEHQLVFTVAEVHILKDHAALQTGIGSSAVALRLLPGR